MEWEGMRVDGLGWAGLVWYGSGGHGKRRARTCLKERICQHWIQSYQLAIA